MWCHSKVLMHLYPHHYHPFQKHENAAFQGHDPSVLPDPVSEESVRAVTAQSG